MTLTKKENEYIEEVATARMELHFYILKLVARPLRGRETEKLTKLISRAMNISMKITEVI
jgi:hypothetical protein